MEFIDEPITVTPEEQLLDLMDLQRALPLDECPVPVAFVTGVAGTGKTFMFQRLIDERPEFAVLAATTGIAAVNLGCTTINSLLKFFNTESLQDAYVAGFLNTTLNRIAQEVENIVIDEVSMMDGRQGEVLYKAVSEVNEYETMKDRGRRLGIILTGDFCQLPPVKAPWMFESSVWPKFAERTIRLTKIWRQKDAKFLEALNFLRSGDGSAATAILKDLVRWASAVDRRFNGTTIVAKNDEVNKHNWLALNELPGEVIQFPSTSWGSLSGQGREKGEWKHVPLILELKKGAYVMVLANSSSVGGWGRELEYANGDCGFIEDVDVQNKQVRVRLVRNNAVVGVPRVTRFHQVKTDPSHHDPTVSVWDGIGEWDHQSPYYDAKKRRFILGGITYMPLRLAYAATVHKVQGLTLDRVQIDSRAHFFGHPGMSYVALSRARSAEDTTIVGTPQLFKTRVNIDPRIRPWL